MLLAISGSSTLESVVQLVGIILIFIFVLAATFLTTRWIANYQRTTTKNRNIRVVETCRLTTNKYIQIVQVGEKYLAIAVAKDTITVLAELGEDEIIDFSAESVSSKGESFGKIMEKIRSMKPKK
ncbi:MAG: flagellar biosynthetic protein FliO [Lachnospiraceae bacterium]|nr:flagellar biosynthetic protein FliO [Lachnospiraceae bacterium]